jgi:hypothetical protein
MSLLESWELGKSGFEGVSLSNMIIYNDLSIPVDFLNCQNCATCIKLEYTKLQSLIVYHNLSLTTAQMSNSKKPNFKVQAHQCQHLIHPFHLPLQKTLSLKTSLLSVGIDVQVEKWDVYLSKIANVERVDLSVLSPNLDLRTHTILDLKRS